MSTYHSVLFLAALLVLVVVFWTKMILSFSHNFNHFSQRKHKMVLVIFLSILVKKSSL